VGAVIVLLLAGVAVAALALAWATLPASIRTAILHGRPSATPPAGTVVLAADRHDGRDETWARRPAAGQPSWGIRGSGEPEAGRMWFDAFPGPGGRYRVELGAVLELDGDPAYRVSVAGAVLGQGTYPHSCGVLLCNATRAECPDRAVHLDLGEHEIARGARVEVWGRATYPCGKHGAYTRWYEVRFVPVPGPGGAE
jgi:hypothetical protein